MKHRYPQEPDLPKHGWKHTCTTKPTGKGTNGKREELDEQSRKNNTNHQMTAALTEEAATFKIAKTAILGKPWRFNGRGLRANTSTIKRKLQQSFTSWRWVCGSGEFTPGFWERLQGNPVTTEFTDKDHYVQDHTSMGHKVPALINAFSWWVNIQYSSK